MYNIKKEKLSDVLYKEIGRTDSHTCTKPHDVEQMYILVPNHIVVGQTYIFIPNHTVVGQTHIIVLNHTLVG